MIWVILGILSFSGLCFMAMHLEEQHHRRMHDLMHKPTFDHDSPPDGPHGPPDDDTPPQA